MGVIAAHALLACLLPGTPTRAAASDFLLSLEGLCTTGCFLLGAFRRRQEGRRSFLAWTLVSGAFLLL
ncbi:MAG TPA: hypothetical protein VFI08_04955, partial [Spirochaetia bacterium]|nr:hypothetical protein [Spirochaetia bacterium]